MTREEMIKALNEIKECPIGLKAWYIIALEMAIQALSQEPCDTCKHYENRCTWLPEENPCDDAISREDAIKAQCEACDICGNMRYTKCQYFMQGCNEVKCLRELPSVTQKSGKWINYSDEGFVECPFCEHATNCEDNIDELHYCFYCGARMVEPQESEDKE